MFLKWAPWVAHVCEVFVQGCHLFQFGFPFESRLVSIKGFCIGLHLSCTNFPGADNLFGFNSERFKYSFQHHSSDAQGHFVEQGSQLLLVLNSIEVLLLDVTW